MTEAKIDWYDKTNPIIRVIVDGRDYSFSVRNFPTEHHEWLCGVLSRQLQEIHDRAVEKTTREFQRRLRDLAGLERAK